MKAKSVQYFFSNWNYDDDEKKRLYEWMEVVVENQAITENHISGFVVENASLYVRLMERPERQTEGGFRTCLVPILNMRDSVHVDFSEIPAENGTFTITVRVTNKADPLDDLLSGFQRVCYQTIERRADRNLSISLMHIEK